MISRLKDSGTFGKYTGTPIPFSSRAYGKYNPSGSDYRSRFYANLRRWRFETLYSSSADEIINNQYFRSIVEMGDIVIPLIVDELRKRPDFLVAAMHLITGENPVSPGSAGDIQKMSEAWLDWYERNR